MFASPINIPIYIQPISLAAANFNGDGKLDLLRTYTKMGSLLGQVLFGNGTGLFSAPQTVFAGHDPYDAVGDFSGNNISDVAVANESSDSVGILLGNGNGTFARCELFHWSRPWRIQRWAISTAMASSTLQLTATSEHRSTGSVGIMFGDGNGGFCRTDHHNDWVRNTGGGVAVGDFNGDGKLDLAIVNGSNDDVANYRQRQRDFLPRR